MEEEDDVLPGVEQAIRDRIDDEMVNHALMERVIADEQPSHHLRRHPPANDPSLNGLSRSNASPRAIRPMAEIRKRVSADMVLAQ
jgi:hypothetical protein